MQRVFLNIEDQIGENDQVHHGDPRGSIVQLSSSRYEDIIKKLWLKFECSMIKTVGEDRFQSKEFFSI